MHLLVGADGSDRAFLAAKHGVELLKAADRVTVLTVITNVPVGLDEDWEETFPEGGEENRQWEAQIAAAQAALARTASTLVATHVDERIEAGDAGQTICDIASELGVDAIIVGSHSRRGLARLRPGSVSAHVVRHAPCPVLVVGTGDGSALASSPP